MKNENQNSTNTLLAFLIGGVAGSVITFLLAPKSGRELRGDIIEKADALQTYASDIGNEVLLEAKNKGENLINKAAGLFDRVKSFSFGGYASPIERIENEISSLKAAVFSAVYSYKNKNRNGNRNLADKFSEEDKINLEEFEDEVSPKHLSMRRRNN